MLNQFVEWKRSYESQTNLKNEDFEDDSQSLREVSKFRLLSDNLSEINSQATVVDHLREFVLVQTWKTEWKDINYSLWLTLHSDCFHLYFSLPDPPPCEKSYS